jgi:hypothetical protein
MRKTPITIAAALAVFVALPAAAGDAAQKTVAAIYKEKAQLKGHQVRLHGKVVKVNNGILHRNFLHVQDGTGTQGSNQVTVTTQDTAMVGEEITVTGTLAVDKDFGAGYVYPVILEHATISRPGN